MILISSIQQALNRNKINEMIMNVLFKVFCRGDKFGFKCCIFSYLLMKSHEMNWDQKINMDMIQEIPDAS